MRKNNAQRIFCHSQLGNVTAMGDVGQGRQAQQPLDPGTHAYRTSRPPPRRLSLCTLLRRHRRQHCTCGFSRKTHRTSQNLQMLLNLFVARQHRERCLATSTAC